MSADLDQNPSPADLAERERENKERKAREDAEQAQLPYKWTQTIRDVDVTAPIPGNLKGRDLDVLLTKNKIRVAIKGQEPLIEVCVDCVPTPENYTVHSKSTHQLKTQPANDPIFLFRVTFPTRSSSMNPLGPSRLPPPRPERKSISTSIR